MFLVLVATILIVLPSGPPAGASGLRTIVVRADSKIGSFRVKRDGTLLGAQEAFGPPTSLRRGAGPLEGWNACVARWRSIGLRIVFYNLGGKDACLPRYGYFRDARMTGRHWRTAAGLRPGDPWRRIFRHYPRARRSPATASWWWLVERRFPHGDDGIYAGLSANVVRRRVVALHVYYQASGD